MRAGRFGRATDERTSGSANGLSETDLHSRQPQSTTGGPMSQPVPPPGWYPDPYDSSKQRYFDGKQWVDLPHPPRQRRSRQSSSTTTSAPPRRP
ncbi:hypothetical protein I552_10210 [Mycobacterium xenopi 3993]|nr:hypothetical protein I552_10210 [Mycobacterium xenopi 3993]